MNHPFWHEIRNELQPFDGRLATAWRLGVICALTAMVFMIWQLPLVAIGCYLVLFIMRPDPGESTLKAMAICVLVSVMVALLVWLTQLSISNPTLRLMILASSSFLFLYIGSASKLGEIGGIIALVIAFIMTLLGMVPVGELATRGILYAWLMTLIPMMLLIVCNCAFGLSVPRLLRKTLAHRLSVIDDIMADRKPAAEARPLLRQGNALINSYLMFISLFHLAPSKEVQQLRTQHERTLQLLLLITRQADLHLPAQSPETAAPNKINADATAKAVLKTTLANCRQLLDTPVPDGPKDPPATFFRADALTNPQHSRFALKTTLAASLAYIVYTALEWQDIHTALVTCYVAALGSTGETVHKLALRITGCLIGAAMGVASLLLLMPLMTSIGELMLLVFAGTLIAGWVSSGSERISYAGVQIGLAFLMTVLQGFGPDIELSVAMDRIIGILLGNTLMFIIFTRIWPVSSLSAAQSQLMDVQEQLITLRLNAVPGQVLKPSQASALLGALNQAREQLAMQRFEPKQRHADTTDTDLLQRALNHTETLCVAAALDPDWSVTPVATTTPESPDPSLAPQTP